MDNRIYIAIDLKSFYASVECVERGLDPLTTNLVVADESRTEKTICLAVTPSLKSCGIPGRPRLFEVVEQVRQINARRRAGAPGRELTGSSTDAIALKNDPTLGVDYIVAPPQMAHYMAKSSEIYGIYLHYAAPEDIHVYSVDEVFIDATQYLRGRTPHDYAMEIIRDVLRTTGITATAGIGTNLYLCKVAMDIVAKRMPADADGVRVAELTERTYREQLWDHRPLTDFWRVGPGYARKLQQNGMQTMGDVARCSLEREDLLYRLFGVNAELIIDHAWGREICTIRDIKSYRPAANSLSVGQVLAEPYDFPKARIIVREMIDGLALDLLEKGLTTDQVVLTVGYDVENLSDPGRRTAYHGAVAIDRYGRAVPKHAHGTENLGRRTASARLITEAMLRLYDRITDRELLVRRINVVANRVQPEGEEPSREDFEQLDFFTDYAAEKHRRAAEETALERERRRQEAILAIRHKYGKNAIFRGTSLQEGATGLVRNGQVGGHRA